MKIHELDEFQGLTLDMVHAWLTKYRWSSKTPQSPEVRLRWWGPPRETTLGIWLPDELDGQLSVYLGMALETVASDFGWSVQEILRELNPRMREITDGAFRSHSFNGGWWIVEDANGEPTVHRLLIKMCPGAGWPRAKGWPCDQAGNKVRWPTCAQGNML